MKLRLLCLLVSVLLLAPSVASAQESTPTPRPKTLEYVVTADSANLRGGPGTSFARVGTVTKGDILLIYDETPSVSGWLRVFREGQEDAYIADFLVERAPSRFYPLAQKPILKVSGRGRQITEVYDIPRGLYRVDANVQSRSFILKVVTIDGNCDDETIFNELNFDSRQLTISSLLVSAGCSVVFETDNVSGNWSFELRDVLDEEFLFESTLTIEDGTTISGKGRSVTMMTQLPRGVWRISAKVQDNSFILRPQVASGDCSEFSVFNELEFDASSLEVSTLYRSTGNGCLIFWDVLNVDGSWEITFNKAR